MNEKKCFLPTIQIPGGDLILTGRWPNDVDCRFAICDGCEYYKLTPVTELLASMHNLYWQYNIPLGGMESLKALAKRLCATQEQIDEVLNGSG